MSYAMTDYLISLSNPDILAAHRSNPEASMVAAGLNEQQQQAIKSGDLYRIRRLSAEEMIDDSLHAKLLMRSYIKHDPDFKYSSDVGLALPIEIGSDVDTETDVDMDVDTDETVNNHDNGVDLVDVGDDENVSDIEGGFSFPNYYEHLFDPAWSATKANELFIVGTGINGANHLSSEALALIKCSDKILYCVADLVIERQIHTLNKNSEDLYILYGDNKPRRQTYEEMAETILSYLHSTRRVCAVFYGHPGIFVWPSFRAIQVARREGYRAHMLPAISSLDCLFADVGFDPSRRGCQVIEATDMLVRNRKPDTTSAVVVFQIGCVGDLGYNSEGYDRRNLPVFCEYLSSFYGWSHEVILYEAAQYPVCSPKVRKLPISDLSQAKTSGISTLYIPPKSLPEPDFIMLGRLGLEAPQALHESSERLGSKS